MKLRSTYLFALVSLAAGAVASYLVFPYYLIPSDDRSFLLDPNPTSPRPVFMALLWAAKQVCTLFDWPASQAWGIWLVLSFSVTGFVICLLAQQLTRNRWTALLTGLLYFTGPWTGAYFFWGNYAPIANCFALLSLVPLWNKNPSRRLRIFSGLMVGAYFWSSPNGLLWVLVLAIWYRLQQGGWRGFRTVALTALLTIVVGLPSSGTKIFTHWQDNLNAERFRAFEQAMGFAATVPWASFLRIAWVHQELYVLLLGMSLIAIAFVAARRIKVPRPYFALAWLTFGWGILIDVLPFTKLGRTHYLAVPFSFLFAIPFIFWLLTLLSPKTRKLTSSIFIMFLLCLAIDGGMRILKIREAKQSAWNFARGTSALALLSSDIQGWHWQETLSQARIPVQVVQHPAELSRSQTLLVGPHGNASGRTALRAALAPDWNLTEEDLQRAGLTKIASLPAYGYLPAFAMESEFAQSLYFQGLLPSPQDPLLQMTFWRR